MAFVETNKYFMDCKFDGIQKLNDSCINNISAINKMVRIFKEYYIAQDNYSKAVSKINVNLAQLTKNKSDCFYSVFDAFSTTFCVFTNVQKEFTESINNIIKSLTVAIEKNDENLIRVLNSGNTNVISNFKNIFMQLEKARQKYNSTIEGDKSDKTIRNTRTNYEMIINKYNNMREDFFDIMIEGFDRSKQYQFGQLETMRKCVKNLSNSWTKWILDMKESVDSLKRFYRLNPKEDLFQTWVDSNKTVDDNSPDPFPPATIDTLDSTVTDSPLIDISTSSSNGHRSPTNTPEIRSKKVFQSRRSVINLSNGQTDIEQDIPDASGTQISSNNKKTSDKTNIGNLKNSKRRWSGFPILKKFQSANDLVNVSEIKQSTNEDGWQSRTNLNESVVVDDEGFIVRDSNIDSIHRLSRSSSSNSNDTNQLRKIKVYIRPVNSTKMEVASKSEIINAALQLPLPKREKTKSNQQRRVSNLHRSSRHVSQLSRDKYNRRSVSVSELRCSSNSLQFRVSNEEKPNQNNYVIPIATAMTERLSSEDGGYTCTIQGRLVLAFPMAIQEIIQPHMISFELVSQSYEFSSVEILKPYQDVAILETISPNKRNLLISKELLERISADQTISITRNKISFPLLDYSVNINRNKEQIIECVGQWSQINESSVKFDFVLSSRYIDDDKFVKLKIQLLTVGTIENVSSKDGMTPEIHDDRCWSVEFGKFDHCGSVRINRDNGSLVRLKFSYEFVFEKCSLVMPHLLLAADQELNTAFKISLIHYRTVSTGNFSQLFVFNIS